MKHFPIFLSVEGQRIVVSGGGEAALAKLRLLLKTEARLAVYAADPAPGIIDWAAAGRLHLTRRGAGPGDMMGAALVYAANDDAAEDARVAALARAEDAPVNIVDNLHDSDFITPAIVDRDPVTVAIGTEGAAPVLARAIKRDLEERLPANLGILAHIGKAFRPMAEKLPMGRARRAFWSAYYAGDGARALQRDGVAGARQALDQLLQRHLYADPAQGHVAFVGAGPGDPELLTLKARRALDDADVVIHDRLVAPEILELARREAVLIEAGKTGFGPSTPQAAINDLMVQHAATGARVVRLKSGDPTVFGRLDEEIEALEAADLDWSIVPGITAASAAVAALGQSLTKRGRNGAVRLITGHDMQGFAERDWRRLARPGEVAAIYMGRAAARFAQGRLLMHGGDPATPVSFVENASRAAQRIVATTLAGMAGALEGAQMTGPVLTVLGLEPRGASDIMTELQPEEMAL